MPKPDGAPGQQQVHTATRTNPATGEIETREFTQEQWRARDKADGWTRPEDDGTDSDEPTDGGSDV
jgi:hypothetical protein